MTMLWVTLSAEQPYEPALDCKFTRYPREPNSDLRVHVQLGNIDCQMRAIIDTAQMYNTLVSFFLGCQRFDKLFVETAFSWHLALADTFSMTLPFLCSSLHNKSDILNTPHSHSRLLISVSCKLPVFAWFITFKKNYATNEKCSCPLCTLLLKNWLCANVFWSLQRMVVWFLLFP